VWRLDAAFAVAALTKVGHVAAIAESEFVALHGASDRSTVGVCGGKAASSRRTPKLNVGFVLGADHPVSATLTNKSASGGK
jgi:hypothetical protein